MCKSVKMAEEAAWNGKAEDFNTQYCEAVAASILTPSPRLATDDDEIASTGDVEPTIVEPTTVGEIAVPLTPELDTRQEASLDATAAPNIDDTIEQPLRTAAQFNPADVESTQRESTQVRRNSSGLSRPFAKSKEQQPADFEQNCCKEFHKMEEYSQKSSLSPTQPNSESAYAHLHEICNEMTSTYDGVASDEVGENRTQKESLGSKQHQSAVTDSTTFTYGEDDTGHVNLSLAEPENQEMDLISQDASFAPQLELFNEMSYEPKTPAPPVNPFSQKGSVMKGHEMFRATQPSSIGRHFASPTSSRPSPNVYNNSSPHKRMTTSPLECRDENPAQYSSVGPILRTRSMSPPRVGTSQMTSSRSFDSRKARREPKDTYVSTKESQERRRKASSASRSESELDSESETEAIPRKRQRDRERQQRIQREFAQITSSRPSSSISRDVEVPASGRRRRSVQEDYIAQCNGSDARDTQQEDVVIDSQTFVEGPEAMEAPDDLTASARSQSPLEIASHKSSPQLPAQRSTSVDRQRISNLYSSRPAEVTSPSKEPTSPTQQPSLPLQEVSTNLNDLRTPVGQQVQVLPDGADMTIPNTILETSPLGDDRIRPMGEVTSFSLAENAYDDAVIDEAPGFTQDFEFNNAINPRFSLSPPSKSRTQDRGLPSLEHRATNSLAISTKLPGAEPSNVVEADDTPKVTTHSKLRKGIARGSEERRYEGSRNKPRVSASIQLQQDAAGGNENKGLDKEEEQKQNVEIQVEEVVAQLEVEEDRPLDVASKPEEQNKTTAEVLHNKNTPNEQQKCPTKVFKTIPKPQREPAAKRSGLRSKEELKGPSKALRRSGEPVTPRGSNQRPSRFTKSTSVVKTNSAHSSKLASDASSFLSTPLSSLASTPAPTTRSSTRKKTAVAPSVNDVTPAPASKARRSMTQAPPPNEKTLIPVAAQRSSRRSGLQAKKIRETSASFPPNRSSKRKSVVLDDEEPVLTRVSKRSSITVFAEDFSVDPIATPTSTLNAVSRPKKSHNLFSKMAFAVSYVKQEKEKAHVTELINEQGGRILDDGFEKLFESSSTLSSRGPAGDEDASLVLTNSAKSVGFVALIADEHSRKAKYMQALALGLPCISGRWIMACVCKGEVVRWNPYLLCAGQSTFLGDAIHSRTLAPYSATEAKFSDTLSTREKLLGGKSILLVTAKGKVDTRKAYVFLTRALGPTRIGQVSDYEAARKKLSDDETWDLLYVDKNQDAAEATVFGSSVSKRHGSKKRKRGSVAAEVNTLPAPKKIRVINDELIIQSLILGQLLEEGV